MTSGTMNPLALNAYTASSALGLGLDATWVAIKNAETGLSRDVFLDTDDLKTWTGKINEVDDVVIPEGLSAFDCRNNKLVLLALEQDGFLAEAKKVVQTYGSKRVGLFLGTSTSGILETELAYQEAAKSNWQLPSWYHYAETHNNYSLTHFVSKVLGISGPAQTISTACSSSANVFSSAQRAISAGLCDAAIVGGVDTLCLTTLYGFHSLQLLSEDICRPADLHRDGINIGEGAAFSILTNEESDGCKLYGYGESSDAYHMSSPHPEGYGAAAAMGQAIKMAGLPASKIDYINLHGTGTKANDSSESAAVHRLFGSVPCSSTKGWTGHTLGAAGALEAVISCLSIKNNVVPQSLNTTELDPALKCAVALKPINKELNFVLSNSFGFGGNNCSLLLGAQ